MSWKRDARNCVWACCPPDYFLSVQETKAERKTEKKEKREFELPPRWLVVLTATVGLGLMSSRPHFNESAPPKKSPSHSLLNPLLEAPNSVAKCGESQPTGTGPQDPQLGSSVCVCVCLWAAEWSLSSLKSQPIHLRPPLATEKLTNYHFFPLPSVFFFFSNQRAVGCIISLTSAVWGGVNLLITTQGHI